MTPITVSQYVDNHVKLADKWLSDHVVLHHEQHERVGIVEVGKPNGSFEHRCEIVLVRHSGHLVVTGDHDTMCFGRYSGPNRVSAAIAWMARDGVCGYVREKASIGMSGVGVDTWIAEVALSQAESYRDDVYEQEAQSIGDEYALREARLWREVAHMIRDGYEQNSILEHIYDNDGDGERCDIGVVPSQRLLWAWSIIRKADQLLTEKDPARV